ncbi:MAG: mechanosensitive ion channel family protein [Acidobacteriia bacterium]|nr:mechanosensitive ion channel family protein [Terriglobia bacterium]
MRPPSYLLTAAVAVLLAVSLAAFLGTRSPGPGPVAATPAARNAPTPLVDDRLLQTARQLYTLADTSAEQDLAREALRLSDHELDQAFATALRQAEAVPPPAAGPLQQPNARVTQMKGRLAADQARVTQLTKQAATDDSAVDQLAVAKAQQELDQDDLDDAQQDLMRQGGDRHATLERALQEHEAADHRPAPVFRTGGPEPAGTLVQQAQLWLDLNGRDRQLLAARTQASEKASELLREHEALDAQAGQTGSRAAVAQASDATGAVSRLRKLSDVRKTLTEFDKRIQDSKQLVDVYGRWSTAVEGRRRDVLHRMTGSFAGILGILLAAILINRAIGHGFHEADRRRLAQLRTVSKLAVRVTAALMILLIGFGPPTQVTTLIGLATAGLTVALKDFIVGFLGWFVLLGRNGLHVGDWVEIEGVSGEVIEIGLLKTVLLEVGNWAATGHPTGRRVAFVNSFAIEGHFFNFSTAGQWLWDQLQVSLPAGGDPYRMAEQITEAVGRETEAEARQAEQDWQRMTAQYGVREFSAKPAVELRPGGANLDVVVRYITRAPQRYQVKSRLFGTIIGLMHQSAGASKPA